MVVKLSSFLSTSLAEGLDSALVTGIIQNTDVALDSGTTGNYIAQITAGDGITVLNGAAHEANATIRVDSASVATSDNTLTITNKTFNLTNNTLTGTLGQFNAALNGATFVSTDGPETLTSKTINSPTINTPQIVGPGSFSKITTLGLRDQTTNAYDLRVQSNSSTNLTDNRTLTVDVQNVNRTVRLGGNFRIGGELRVAGGPFVGAPESNLLMNLTDSTNITLPTSGTVMSVDSNGASTITGAFTAGTLSGHYLGADSDVTELVTKAFVDNLGVDAVTLGGRDSDYYLNYNNFTNLPAGSAALVSLGNTPPGSPQDGQLWWDDSAGNLYLYFTDSEGDTQWVEAVPQLVATDFVSSANITNSSTGTTFSSNSYNIVQIQTDKDDNGSNDDAVLQFTNGSANTVKAELRFDESQSTFEIGRGDNQNHMSMNDSGITTFSERVYIGSTNVPDGFGFGGEYTYGLNVGGMTTISGPNSYDALTVENTSTDFAGARIRLRDGNSTAGQYSFWYQNSDVTYFNSNNSTVAWQSTADGMVTKPNQPMFKANYNGNAFSVAASTKITHNREILDVGGDFDPTNSRFTAPTEGKYMMLFHTIFQGNYSNAYVDLYVNGAIQSNNGGSHHFSSNEGTSAWHSIYITTILELYTNDYVEIFNGASGTVTYHGNRWHQWSGYLLG